MAKRSPDRRRSKKGVSPRNSTEVGRASPARTAKAEAWAKDVTADVQRRNDLQDDAVPTPPSSLDMDRHASAARSGRAQMAARRRQQKPVSPEISAGDVDADWMDGYFVGDEAAAGDNPTPEQQSVEEVGRAVGVDYEDNEQLRSTDKISRRDRKRWELDPASAEDYKERNKRKA